MKKVLSWILMILLMLVTFAMGSSADQSFVPQDVDPASPEDFIYISNGSEVQINGYKGKGGIVRIPEEIDGVPVTRIGPKAFHENLSITGIVLQNNLRHIGEQAFYDCTNLTGVLYLPPSVEVVSSLAFAFTNITGVIITSTCKLTDQVFLYAPELEFVYITEGCAPTIGWRIFLSDEKLETFIIPDTVNSINIDNFTQSNHLTFYTPANSTAHKFAQDNFMQCNTDQYEAIKKEYDEKYAHYILAEKERDADIGIKDSASENTKQSDDSKKNVDGSRTSGLYTYSIKGNGTVSIIDYDWSKSSGDIYIPSMLDGYNVTAIAEEAFAYGKKDNKVDALIVIPNSITLIGEKAFYNSPVSTISIPASVQSIGKAAFAYCDITQFIVDQNQPYFATIDGVLYDKRNKSLMAHPQKKKITGKIPEGILSIGEYAFSGMIIGQGNSSTLCFTDILPSTLTRIEAHAFEKCTIYYSKSNTQSGFSQNKSLLSLLPKKVTVIDEYAFSGCTFKCNSSSKPETIMISANLEEVGDYAFSECRFYDGFEFNLIISESEMERIGCYAFASAVIYSSGNERTKIRIQLPDRVEEADEKAFFETYSVYMKEDSVIREIGSSAFRNTIVYTKMKNTPSILIIPGKMKRISSSAFAYKLKDNQNTVEEIVIQDGVKVIGESAFAGRKSLQRVSLPMTLTEIGEKAFEDCQEIKEMAIPESVTKIGDDAFERQFITLIVKENSYAALWASENGYNFRYESNGDSLDWLNSDIH